MILNVGNIRPIRTFDNLSAKPAQIVTKINVIEIRFQKNFGRTYNKNFKNLFDSNSAILEAKRLFAILTILNVRVGTIQPNKTKSAQMSPKIKSNLFLMILSFVIF